MHENIQNYHKKYEQGQKLSIRTKVKVVFRSKGLKASQ